MLKKILISMSFLFLLSSESYGKPHRKSYVLSPKRNVKLKTSSRKKAKKVPYQSIQSIKKIKKQRLIDQSNLEDLKRQEQKRLQQEVCAAQKRQQQAETVRRTEERKHHETFAKNHTKSIYQDLDIIGLFKFGSYGQNKIVEMIETEFYSKWDLFNNKRMLKAPLDDV